MASSSWKRIDREKSNEAEDSISRLPRDALMDLRGMEVWHEALAKYEFRI
jgi:hypothetical protein